MKTKLIYAIVFAMIAGSWIGNVSYYQYYRLPEGSFLNHRIETNYKPNVAFDLLYAANSDDKRKIVDVRVDSMPALHFYPIQVHQELQHQTIYILRGYYDETIAESRNNLPPLVLHTVKVSFNDGAEEEKPVGDIVVYRDPWPADEKDRPVEMTSSGGGSNGSGFATIRTTRPVTLTGVTSHWLDDLGTAFEYEVKTSSDRADVSGEKRSLPIELEGNGFVSIHYQFRMSEASKLTTGVYNLILSETYKETNGQTYVYPVFANHLPYPTETEMRAYVKAKRREAK